MKRQILIAILAAPMLLAGNAIAESVPRASNGYGQAPEEASKAQDNPAMRRAAPDYPSNASSTEVERAQQQREWRQHIETLRQDAERRREEAAARRFELFDKNKDGQVSLEEALSLVREKFGEMDKDKDGAISVSEIQDAMNEMQNNSGRPHRQRHPWSMEGIINEGMFRFIDANSDAKISFEEVKPLVEGFFRALDANRDGVISRDEQDFLRVGVRRPMAR